VELLDYVFRTLRGRSPSIAQDFPHIYCSDNAENVLIVTDGERVIGSTGISINDVQLGDVRMRIGGINCVTTLPEYRKRGLGKALMEAAHTRMADEGCHVGLLGTAIPNWYRRLGWELAGRSRSYSLNRGNIDLLPELPAGHEFEMAEPSPSAEVLAVHHSDRLGGIRTEATFGRLLAAKKTGGMALARKGGAVAAYLLTSGSHIQEWGGPAEITAGLLRAWFKHVDDLSVSTSDRKKDEKTPLSLDAVSLPAPPTGHGLMALLDEIRIPHHVGYPALMRLLNPQGVLTAFGHDDITVTQSGDAFTVRRGREEATLGIRALAKLLFGPERVSDFANDILPLPLWQWPLEGV
jgi:ribosomal protein S18 acetylase RimI-like enzyme